MIPEDRLVMYQAFFDELHNIDKSAAFNPMGFVTNAAKSVNSAIQAGTKAVKPLGAVVARAPGKALNAAKVQAHSPSFWNKAYEYGDLATQLVAPH